MISPPKGLVIICTFLTLLVCGRLEAQTVSVDASKIIYKPEVLLSPKSGSFTEGASFDVPILINTKGTVINSLEIRIKFDRDKLEIVKPIGGESIIGVWVEPPRFDNTNGTASYVGIITNGIKTESGLIGTITFRAKRTGRATVSVGNDSKVFLNDGLGTEVSSDFGRADYNILVRTPDGVRVYSETHPIQGEWYNNSNPIISWDKDAGVDGFSYVLDNKPSTIPENQITTTDTTKAFENLEDGLWYFHIKPRKSGAWGGTGHFLVRIDTKPPAEFKPQLNYITASTVLVDRALVSFFTTDNLSGIRRYEVGVIDRMESTTVSPVFVEAESPYQVPLSGSGKLNVIVRAVDMAGNIRDTSINVEPPSLAGIFIKENLVYLLAILVFVLIAGFVIHYLVGHHIIRHIKRAIEFIKKDEIAERQENQNEVNKSD